MRYCSTLLFVILGFSASRAGHGIQTDGSVPLPIQTRLNPSFDAKKQLELSRGVNWQRFVQQHGTWGVVWNEAIGSPHRAFGKAIRIPGFSQIREDNVQDAAMAFLTGYADMLNVRPENLRLIRATEVNGRWYVSYRQVFEDIDVLFSEVELRIFSNGSVMAFGADFYNDLTVSTLPALSYDAAKNRATEGLGQSATAISGNEVLSILPVVGQDAISYHLVYEVSVTSSDPVGNYVTLVDAHDGALLWRHNRVRYTDVSGRVTGMVQLDLPTDPFVEQGFQDETVLIGTLQVVTDSLGDYRTDISSPTSLVVSLDGPYVNVNRSDGPDAFISTTVNPGDTLNILWDETNSHPAERDGYFHTRLIHDFITTLDPNFTNINYSMPCVVNINSTCNAFWNGFGINFYLEGGGCPNTAQMPDVVYHEYGHGINDKLYQQLGQGFGMINGATHEGMADVASSVILDDPRVGRGFFGPGSVLRNLDNTSSYPEDVSGDPHITGLIIGGAFWDLREATDLETFQTLTHFAKYGLPDDADDGTAFSEWFVETLVADDDDGNLGNGTPHMIQIADAFNAHGIGSVLFFRTSFSHTPVPSTDDTMNPYPVDFMLEGTPVIGGEPESLYVHYSLDNLATTLSLEAAPTNPNEYRAEIPPQPWGTVIRYYVSARDPISGTTITFPSTIDSAHAFMVGAQPAPVGLMYTTGPGSLYTLNASTGAPTLVGSLGVSSLHGLAVRPSTGELYGTGSGSTNTSVYRISPVLGIAVPEATIAIPNMRAIAFAPGGDMLYGATTSGRLYQLDVETWDTTYIGTSTGIVYGALSFSPTSGILWAGVRPPVAGRDKIYTVNAQTAEATLVGSTGFSLQITPGIAFDADGVLYGLTGSGTQDNNFITIDTLSGIGTLVGSTGFENLSGLAMRVDSIATSVEGEQQPVLPKAFALEQNYPNPFNPTTTFSLTIPQSSIVNLSVYDLLGREITTLVNEKLAPGTYTREWDAAGQPSGVYFYRLSAGDFADTKKLLLLR